LPVSKRRRRSSAPAVRSVLRRTGKSDQTLAIARSVKPSYAREAAEWTVRNLQIGGPLRRLKPRRLVDLYRGQGQESLPLEGELAWAAAIVRQNRDVIRSHLGYSAQLDLLLLQDKGDEALSALDDLEKSCGFSLHLVSTKIALLQLYKGLEAQKEYLSWLKGNGASRNLNFFAHWWSVRAEDSTTSRNFHRDFKRRLKRWSLDEPFRAHIAFEVLREMPSEGQEAKLLSGSYLGSAIDVYEAVVSVLQLIVVESRAVPSTLISALHELVELTGDVRLIKLKFLLKQNISLNSLTAPSLAWRNASVAAQPERPIDPPASLEELKAALAANLGFVAEGPFKKRLAADLNELTRPDRATRARDGLMKLAAMFGSLGTGQWLSALADDTESIGTKSYNRTAMKRFLSVPTLEPEVASSLGEIEQGELLLHLPKPEANAYMAWQTRLATKACGVYDDLIAPLPLLELQLLEAFRKNDPTSLTAFAQSYEQQAGKHTYLSVNAHVQGVLGREGLAEAVKLTVQYLLNDIAMTAWLPIRDLASSLIGSERLPPTVIEVAILLDFAAALQASPYSSERTYAIEDYLQAKGALRPTDLLQRIPRSEASDLELYFMRKVCSIAALRTSTLFQNEKELEDERTALCRWFNEQQNDWSEQLEDEAREIVRNRLVRRGLQALEGSKLSVDSSGIKAWAEHAVREDYNRYIDLLRSGVFAIDEDFKTSVFQAIEGDQQASELAIPENEGAALFADVLTRAIREFGLHSEHGLDAYLSLRIRHGTISGHLRGPIEQERLITRRRSDGTYLRNEHWIELLGGTVPPEALAAIDERLGTLSSEFDAIIDRLTKKLIQVRSEEKPEGLINIEVSPAIVAATMVEVSPELSFEDFMTQCEEIFWAIFEASNIVIGAAVDRLSLEVQSLFQEAEQDVRILANDGAGPLRDALLRGRNAAVTQLERMRDWLRTPTTPASLSLDIEALIQVSLSVIQGFYGSFKPKLSVNVHTPIQLAHAVRWFSDVFFIIFENVLKYSGNASDPEVSVSVSEEDDFLSFVVCNSVDEPTDEQRERIETARKRILDGSFRTAVRSEGGTGLPKLAKVIGLGKGGGQLEFQLDDIEREFKVHFKVRKLTLSEGGLP